MAGTREIFIKELSDNLGSKRFWLIFFIIYALGIIISYVSIKGLTIKSTAGESVFLMLFTSSTQGLPSFLYIVTFIAPLLGFLFTFDTINREFSSGTLSNVLSQPVHRDSVINAKVLAGIATVAISMIGVIFLVVGFGIMQLSALPTLDEIARLIIFLFLSVVYISIWVSAGLLFSVLFRREGTSALASVAVWLFFSFFIQMIVTPAKITSLLYTSPPYIFLLAAEFVLNPVVRILGPLSIEQYYSTYYMLPTPLPIEQSLLLVWPHITGLIAVTLIIFALSYVKFMRQEIKAI